MREKVINLGRFGLRKHTEIAENTEISFSNTDLTNMHRSFYKNHKNPTPVLKCLAALTIQYIHFSLCANTQIKCLSYISILLQSLFNTVVEKPCL